MKTLHWQPPSHGQGFNRLMFEADVRGLFVKVAKFAHEPMQWGGEFEILQNGKRLAVAPDVDAALAVVRRVRVHA